jgi:hypothetical protein
LENKYCKDIAQQADTLLLNKQRTLTLIFCFSFINFSVGSLFYLIFCCGFFGLFKKNILIVLSFATPDYKVFFSTIIKHFPSHYHLVYFHPTHFISLLPILLPLLLLPNF